MAGKEATRQPIDSGWVFAQAQSDQPFRAVSQFPTVNHLDLLHHDLIPDPRKDLNYQKVQWVGEKEWIYKTTFDFAGAIGVEGAHHVLVFEGLDTHCRITLNGKVLLRTENMYLEYRVDITDHIRSGPNDLELYFESTFLVGKQLEKDQGFKNMFWNGDSSRMNTRKVPCHYGWDWGPTLLTSGPWRPIYLESFHTRISDLEIDVEVSDDLKLAMVTAQVTLDGSAAESIPVFIEVLGPSGRLLAKATVGNGEKHRFTVTDPQLWFPFGYGEQPLYTIKAELRDGADSASKRVGVRSCELIQRPIPGQDGLTFFFRINNIPIYSQGTDWIPPDVFLPRMTHDRYRTWLTWAVKGNQNMIRVWGGGIYEDDTFYDLCDELGILIWQDFMMGCGAYPYHKYLEDTIRQEAQYNVRRMRHHPCIVLWCGNNEDYMFAEIYKLEYDMNDHNPENWKKSNFPGRYYYEVVLKEVIERLCPRVPYHLSSPYGGTHSNSPLQGDVHSWRVWMADQPRYPYQDYEKLTGRFVSEFGMKSFPCSRTMKALISDPSERHPQSRTLDAWHMAPEDQRTLAMYLIDNLRHGNDLDSYAWATQLIQAESTDYSSRAFRRLWRGPGKEECAGCLIWQLNDCFPAVSWSLLDSNVRPKMAYFLAKRNYEPLLVGATRHIAETKETEFTHVDIAKETCLELWASNLRLSPIEADLEVTFVSIDAGRHIQSCNTAVELPPNRSVELQRLPFPRDYQANPSALVASVRLLERNTNRVLARYVEFPQPLRHNDYTGATITVRPAGNLSWAVSVTGGVAKAVELYVDTDDDEVADACVFSDNCLNLVPGDEQVVNLEINDAAKGVDIVVRERHYG